MKESRVREALKLAFAAGARRDYHTAARLLEEIITETEAPSETYLLLGRSYHALGDYPRALLAFKDFLRYKPHSAQGLFFAGRSYLALGMIDRAIPLIKDASDRKPNDATILALLGVACLKGRRSEAAARYLQNAVELAPDDKRIYKAYLNALLVRGLRLIRGSETELGEQMLLFVLNNGLELPLPHLELGRLYKGAGRLTEALDQYDKAISLSPKDSKLHWYRASLLMALGKDEEARSELSILTDLGSEIPDLEWNAELVDRFLIRSLIEHKDWRRAAEACKVWLKKRKSDPTIHAMLAEALRNLGDYEAAFNHAQRAVESSKDTEPRYALLLILYESEDWKQLKTELIKSERLGLDSEVLLRFTALLGAKTDPDDKKVISLIQEAIRQTGPAPELMFALAERYFRLGLSDLAENWYRKTRTIEKGHERAYLGEIAAAENLLEGGEEEAEDRLRLAYEEYLELWSDNLSIKREYALFLVRQGHYKGASEELRELLAWEPRNATLRRLLAYTYRKTKRYREAAVLLKGLLREQPRELEILMEYVACLQKAKAKEYALAVLEKALPLFPKNSVPVRALAELYLKNGKKEKAIEMYSKAAALSKTDSRSRRALAELYLSSGLGELAQRYENEANMLDNKQGITDSDARKSRV